MWQWSGDLGLIPDGVILKTKKKKKKKKKRYLFNTQHYKVWIKSKWSNPGKGVAPFPTLHVVAIEKRAFRSSSTMVGQLVYNIT